MPSAGQISFSILLLLKNISKNLSAAYKTTSGGFDKPPPTLIKNLCKKIRENLYYH
jgi:hypothetical protein